MTRYGTLSARIQPMEKPIHENRIPMTDAHVQIQDPVLAEHLGDLLAVLEARFPVRLASTDSGQQANDGYVLSWRIGTPQSPASQRGNILILPPIAPGGQRLDPVRCYRIRFGADPAVPWPYRGRTIETSALLHPGTHADLAARADRILATDGEERPIWTMEQRSGKEVYRTSLCVPDAAAGADLGLAASGERFIQVLPIFHFLQQICGSRVYHDPPLRAAFVIDDPNLHWPSYGYVDYRAIAASARLHHYHVAFATIPLDAWWVDPRAAAVFRSQRDYLSLLVHGNDHARQELAQPRPHGDRNALLHQATARIRRLEARSGVQVSPVMVPPHGACSAPMLAALPRHGFEAACISAGSLRSHNAAQGWTRWLGFAPCEIVEGYPVMPRWAFDSASDAVLLSAAYLGQPLILRCHHQDLKSGLGVLEGHAKRINALGNVRWSNLAELARLNFQQRQEGSTLFIRPMSRRIHLFVPPNVKTLQLESNPEPEADTGVWTLEAPHAGGEPLSGHGLTFSVVGGHSYRLALRGLPVPVAPRRFTSGWLILRRVLTEARDRLRLA